MSSGETPARGSWIPWIFVGGFMVMLAANITMVVVATTTWTGIATNRSYDKGRAYNRNLEAAARQAELGWQAAIETTAATDGAGTVAVALEDRDGQPLDLADLVVTFERPTHEGYDFDVRLESRGDGRYSAAFAAPLAGVWSLRLVATRDDALFVATDRVVLP